jgi:hypothetical protein
MQEQDAAARTERLQRFQDSIEAYRKNRSPEARRTLNQDARIIKSYLIEAGCYKTFTIAPPPAIGGLIMRNVDPLDMMFDPPYLMDFFGKISDMIDQAIGYYRDNQHSNERALVHVDPVQPGYVFIAMPMADDYAAADDVHDTIKQAANNCSLHAERVDEIQNDARITDQILDSIKRAQFVVADLSNSKPNVFFEAGYAHGLGKTPIYIAHAQTKLEFDLKDYPTIFSETMRELRTGLEKRLRALAEQGT